MTCATRALLSIGLLALRVAAPTLLTSAPGAPEAAGAPAAPAAPRFDYLVREDFFAGMAGDRARLERAMKLCEATLAREPAHAEAMVWYGSGLLVLAGQSFQGGDPVKGGELWQRGLRTMADAVALAPDRVGVRIPRGATLIMAARRLPPGAQSRELLETGVADYERVLMLQTPQWERLPVHARGELLAGLAEGSHGLGRDDAARAYLTRMVQELAGSAYQARARAWLDTGTPPPGGVSCGGCHRSDGRGPSN